MADGADNRAEVTFYDLKDALGNLVPDGTKVGVTVRDYGTTYNGHSVRSAGGSVIGGEDCANSGYFRIFTVQDGKVVITYSDAGIVYNPGYTNTARVQIVPADDENRIVGSSAIAVAEVKLAGVSEATITAPDTADAGETIDFTITDIRDALGNPVPDGTKVGVTVRDYGTTYNGHYVRSAGGSIIGGEACANNSNFRVFTAQGGEVVGQAILPSSGTMRIQAVVAKPDNSISTYKSFAVKAVTVQ